MGERHSTATRTHRWIGMSVMKETDFFIAGRQFELGPNWSGTQFDLSAAAVGEASRNYTKRDIFEGVPERTATQAPDARLIFVARDSVARLASHYRHVWLFGHMDVLPETLLASGPGKHMLNTSRYAWQLGPWIDTFGRDRLLILDFEALRDDPQDVFDRVCDHIGVARHPVPQVRIVPVTETAMWVLRRLQADRWPAMI